MPRVLRSLPVRLVLVGAVLVLALGASSCGSPPMKPTDGRLPDCPGSPNCVNSMDTDASRHVAPLSFDGDPEAALDRLQEVLLAMPRTTLVEREPGYLHVTFRSLIFRFVDDVQCVADGDVGVIHLRSASRVGHSDLGVNAKRADAIAQAWAASR